MNKDQLLLLADAYKEPIFSKLHDLVLSLLERLDRSVFEAKTTEEVLALVYMPICKMPLKLWTPLIWLCCGQ